MNHGIPIRTEKVLCANEIAEFSVGQDAVAGADTIAGGDVCRMAVWMNDVDFQLAVR
jgi:hypothetical protein